jgi:hypothetical protein
MDIGPSPARIDSPTIADIIFANFELGDLQYRPAPAEAMSSSLSLLHDSVGSLQAISTPNSPTAHSNPSMLCVPPFGVVH